MPDLRDRPDARSLASSRATPSDEPGESEDRTANATVAGTPRLLADRANVRCRLVLEYLDETRDATTVDELAMVVRGRLAKREPGSGPRVDAVRVSLYHRHLPVLDDEDALSFDAATGVVEPAFDDAVASATGRETRELRGDGGPGEAREQSVRRR